MATRTGNVYNTPASRQPSREPDEQVEREEAAQATDDSLQTPLPATHKGEAPATQSSQQAENDALRRMIERMHDQQRLSETRFQQELERLRSERSSGPQRRKLMEPLPTIQQAFPEGMGAIAFEIDFIR